MKKNRINEKVKVIEKAVAWKQLPFDVHYDQVK